MEDKEKEFYNKYPTLFADIKWLKEHHEIDNRTEYEAEFVSARSARLYNLRKMNHWDKVNGYPNETIKDNVLKQMVEWDKANDLIIETSMSTFFVMINPLPVSFPLVAIFVCSLIITEIIKLNDLFSLSVQLSFISQ